MRSMSRRQIPIRGWAGTPRGPMAGPSRTRPSRRETISPTLASLKFTRRRMVSRRGRLTRPYRHRGCGRARRFLRLDRGGQRQWLRPGAMRSRLCSPLLQGRLCRHHCPTAGHLLPLRLPSRMRSAIPVRTGPRLGMRHLAIRQTMGQRACSRHRHRTSRTPADPIRRSSPSGRLAKKPLGLCPAMPVLTLVANPSGRWS